MTKRKAPKRTLKRPKGPVTKSQEQKPAVRPPRPQYYPQMSRQEQIDRQLLRAHLVVPMDPLRKHQIAMTLQRLGLSEEA